jgi:glucokinase
MEKPMFLGIEIGGTKLQFGVGAADGQIKRLERADVDLAQGAEGIRRQIAAMAAPLIAEHNVAAIGFGFGGPVDATTGRIVKSHQVDGWDDFPLVNWTRETLGLPAALANDSDMAGLGEAHFGAGRGKKIVLYSNVGTGIGGSLVINGRVYAGSRGIASEIGHLRPGVVAEEPETIVEAVASGPAIAAAAETDEGLAAEIRRRSDVISGRFSAKMVAELAAAGNNAALSILRRATQTYGWAIAQAITLVSPEVVVIGGGVSLIGNAFFFDPLRKEVKRYVFPPLRGTYEIVPAALGEEVVVHGALALARALAEHGNTTELFTPQ